MTETTYKQCKLRRPNSDGSGTIDYVAWIPSKFAIAGKNIIINDVEWNVLYVSQVEMSGKFIHDVHGLDKLFPSIQKKPKAA